MSNWKELARSKGLKQADIIAFFFDHNDINHFTCRACKQVYSCTHCHARGYSNLFSHLERLHPVFAEVLVEILSQAECMVNLQPSHFEKLNSSRMRKAINLFRWIEWIIIHDLPFSFVESEYTRKNTSLDPISINALLLGMEKLAEKVADRIKDDLPASFGLIFDGWSQSGTHFLAVFASYYNKESKIASSKGACYPMLSLAPLLNETSFTADEHITFFGELLTLYGKSIDNVAFFVGDNCETNQCISRRLNIPLIGCAAHKLKLAVKLIFTNYNTLISKMKTAISELSTLKNRGFLRSIDALAPVSWNDTRWTSTFHALNRYVTLHPMLRDNQNTPMEVRSKLLSSEEFEQLKALQERLNILYSTSEYLQSEKCDLAHARLLLDKIVERFRFVAGVEEKIGPEGALVVDPCFESAIVKVLNEEFRTLTTTEVQKLKPFEVPIASEHQSNKRRNEAEDIIEQESERKRQKYIPLNHIPASSALVERSFSHADLIFEPRRRAMTPLHLELCLFLKFNRLLWEVEYLIEY